MNQPETSDYSHTDTSKHIYDRNKECLKYSYESMKYLDSKFTRLFVLANFLIIFFTTGLHQSESWIRNTPSPVKPLLILVIIAIYTALSYVWYKSLDAVKPSERTALATNEEDTRTQLKSSLEVYEINCSCLSLAKASESLSNRNDRHAKDLTELTRVMKPAFIGCVVCLLYIFLSTLMECNMSEPAKPLVSQSSPPTNSQGQNVPQATSVRLETRSRDIPQPQATKPQATSSRAMFDSANGK